MSFRASSSFRDQLTERLEAQRLALAKKGESEEQAGQIAERQEPPSLP